MAELLEHMVAHAAPARPPASTLRAVTVASNLAYARTCYDHLAGRLGVVLTDAMIRNGVVDDTAGFSITAPGIAWLDGLGVDTAALRAGRRPMARACLDWTERRPHLAGAVGAVLCRQLLDRGWLTRISGQRALRVTAVGRSGLAELFAYPPCSSAREAVMSGGRRLRGAAGSAHHLSDYLGCFGTLRPATKEPARMFGAQGRCTTGTGRAGDDHMLYPVHA